MPRTEIKESEDFLKSLGFPTLDVHETFSHFDFSRPSRRVLLIGPMGSGKTEYAARIWKDAEVARLKSDEIREKCTTGTRDRRNVFFIRSKLDRSRFSDYPEDVMPYRSGHIECKDNIAYISDSFDFENAVESHREVGTFIVDEASFFDERLIYVARNYALEEGCIFIFPTLILNFRREFFNSTSRLILDMATDVIPITAYCEHRDCMQDAFYTYRYYSVDGLECPALYFDPLIIVGGDRVKESSLEPNYASRCEKHHYLPGKEYSFFTLKPLGREASNGSLGALERELGYLKENIEKSELYKSLKRRYKNSPDYDIYLSSLKVSFIAEKALAFLFSEQSLLSEDILRKVAADLHLNTSYLERILSDNHHPIQFDQMVLL